MEKITVFIDMETLTEEERKREAEGTGSDDGEDEGI